MGTGYFPGVKQPGGGVDHPTLSNAEVKERVEQYPYFPSGPLWPVLVWDFIFYLGKIDYEKLKGRGVLHVDEKMKLRYSLKELVMRLRMYGSASRSVSNSSYYKSHKDKRQRIYLSSNMNFSRTVLDEFSWKQTNLQYHSRLPVSLFPVRTIFKLSVKFWSNHAIAEYFNRKRMGRLPTALT